MDKWIVSAVQGVCRGVTRFNRFSPAVVLYSHFSTQGNKWNRRITCIADFNSSLKDYVLKQELKKDFTHYKEEADRRELFREVYLNLSKDGNKAMYLSWFGK